MQRTTVSWCTSPGAKCERPRRPDGRPVLNKRNECKSCNLRAGTCSNKQLADDVPVDVGQPAVGAVMPKRQPFVINSQQVQDGGVQVVDLDRRNPFPGP